MHESAGVHMADGYYRVTGQPLAVFTSIGPGGTQHCYKDEVFLSQLEKELSTDLAVLNSL